MSGEWRRLGSFDPRQLSPARLELHHAAQIVSAIGITHLLHQPDDGHTNLEWIPALGAFGGNLVEGKPSFRGALRPGDFTLMLLDEAGHRERKLPLSAKTLDEGYVWMAEAVASETGKPMQPLERPAYELPDHAVAEGSRFSMSMESFQEIGRWYGNAASLLISLMAEFSEASPVRCWPHHFDIAILLTLGGGKTVGLGLSPGDSSYAEPYWYVTPYPYPKDPKLPPLPEKGRWHTEGFFAAVLTGSDLLAGDPAMQRQRSETFLRAALEVCRRLVG